MILAVAASQLEMTPFLRLAAEKEVDCASLISGVGPVETTLNLTRFLLQADRFPDAVVNFGVGGAYRQPAGAPTPGLLDICLAQSEVFGDFGICLPDRLERLPAHLGGPDLAAPDPVLRQRALEILQAKGVVVHTGPFVTVNSASGTSERGTMLQREWNGLCENMEGAAVARVCTEFQLPFVEIRAISNYVEDRDVDNWKLAEACEVAAKHGALLIRELG